MKHENKFLIFHIPKEKGLKRFIKGGILTIARVYYNILSKFCCPKDCEIKKYKVSILAIFKNEEKYLKEWIEFHKIVGIEHFYLYNNNSEDNYKKVLQPYIDEGIVTLMQWHKNQAQMECYNDGISRFSNESEWIAIVDIDEFIVPNFTDCVYDFLKNFRDKPAVLVYWKFFGTSAYLDRSRDELVTEDFILGWRKYANIGKCFYNTRFSFDGTHKRNHAFHHFLWANYKGHELPPVNVFGKICLLWKHPIPMRADKENFPMQINHYFTKSYQEYIDKRKKGDVYFKQDPHTVEYFYEHEMVTQKADYHAYKYLIKLKIAMDKGNNTELKGDCS